MDRYIPGGLLVSGMGGKLWLNNWTPSPGITGASTQPNSLRFLDVYRWELFKKRESATLYYSGNHGSVRRRIVAEDWWVRVFVWYNYQDPPWQTLNNTTSNIDEFAGGGGLNVPAQTVWNLAGTMGIALTIGSDTTWLGDHLERTVSGDEFTIPLAEGDGILDRDTNFIPYYASPMCVWTQDHVVDSSEGDDVVRHEILLEADSLMWYIDSQSDQDAYRVYYNKLTNLMAGTPVS